MQNDLMPMSDPWSELVPRLITLGQASRHVALMVLGALLVLLLGWVVANVLSRLLGATLRLVRFDTGFRRVFLGLGSTRQGPTGVAAWILYWVVMSVAALLALEVLGFNLAAPVAARLGEIIPRIVTAAVLFAVGSLIAILIGGIAQRFLESAGMRASRLQGQVVTAVLTAFSVLLALEQLGLAAQFVMAIGVVAVAAAGAGLALAFGLGCRELARDFLLEYLRTLEDDPPRKKV